MPAARILLLGAHEALGHRLLRDQERAGDLLRAQAAERAQGQRDLRIERERRVAAREEELQALVGDRRLVHLVLRRLRHVEQPGLARRACGRGGCGRSRGCARLSRATRAGCPACPSRGQRSAAIANASCAASSARSKSPRKPIRAARTRPHSSRKTRSRYRSSLLRAGGSRPRRRAGRRDRATRARSPRRGRRPRRRSSRRAPP